jgi:hypothetical protein
MDPIIHQLLVIRAGGAVAPEHIPVQYKDADQMADVKQKIQNSTHRVVLALLRAGNRLEDGDIAGGVLEPQSPVFAILGPELIH